MNLHPIFVHFPIALLTVYAVLELIRFKKVIVRSHWFETKALIAILGAASAAVAYLTGPEEGGSESSLHEMHRTFATMTLVIFLVIGLVYLIEWIWPNKYSFVILKPHIIMPLAILGLISVTITGGLGGALVYGTHFDPFMTPVFKFLGVY